MSEPRWNLSGEPRYWRRHPFSTSVLVTAAAMLAMRVAVEMATKADGWLPVFHIFGLFAVVYLLVDQAGKP